MASVVVPNTSSNEAGEPYPPPYDTLLQAHDIHVFALDSRTEKFEAQVSDAASSYFLLIVAGRIRWSNGERFLFLSSDSFLHIPAGHQCRLESQSGQAAKVILVKYRPEALPHKLQARLGSLSMFPFDLNSSNVSQARAIRSIFQEMLFEQSASQEEWELILRANLVALAVRTLRLANRRSRRKSPVIESRNESSERVAQYALVLKEEFQQQETLAEAASRVGLSPRQFTRVFRQTTGQNWCKYVLDLRLQHAAGLLVATDRSVLDVAFESGFEDLSYFHRCFKSTYGCSPVKYREQRQVRLPAESSASTDDARALSSSPGFKYRGIKGWFWNTKQYLEEIPGLAELKMNFLMDCDGAWGDSTSGLSLSEEWWEPMSEARQQAYSRVISSCNEHGLNFCFVIHPLLANRNLLDSTGVNDRLAFIQHFLWIQKQGVKWFGICLDGTSWGPAGPVATGIAHASLVNEIYGRLFAEDEETNFLFRPAACSGDGSNPEQRAYLGALAQEMHPDVFVFWDGDSLVTPRITRVAAANYKRLVRHRLFLWDNYPANDGSPTLHLGPLSGRDSDLCEVIDGYLSNSMHPQNQINRIPLATCAEYAFSPTTYNASRSIGHAIIRFAKTDAQQQILKQLVEAYPGFIVAGGGTGTNPVRQEFSDALAEQGPGLVARKIIRRVEDLSQQLMEQFPIEFLDARKTLEDDIMWMKQQL